MLGGGSNRISGVVFPFALAHCSWRMRGVLPAGKARHHCLYFVQPGHRLRDSRLVAVHCGSPSSAPAPAPAQCALGLERPLTGARTLPGVRDRMGIVAILTGFFALVMLYRRHSVIPPTAPPYAAWIQ